MICFRNPGVLDIQGATVFGLSVKEGSNPIGFFGTGLKYAIAVALRCGCTVDILAGEERFHFSTKRTSFRGKPVSIVTMNDQPLGFTLDLGKTWELWMAYREFWCNCQDEGGTVERLEALPPPQSGTTQIVVSGGEFLLAHAKRSAFLLGTERTLLTSASYADIYLGQCNGIFYRGVRIQDFPQGKRSLFTYNIKRPITLTEDRTAKYSWEVQSHIERALIESTDRQVLTDVLAARKEDWEHELDFRHYNTFEGSEEFVETVQALTTTRMGDMNQSALQWYKAKLGTTIEPEGHPLSPDQEATLGPVLAFCEDIGYTISAPVLVSANLGEGVQALAYQGKIFLANRILLETPQYLARALIEEQVHISTGFADCCRDMQNYLFESIVKTGERLLNKRLGQEALRTGLDDKILF